MTAGNGNQTITLSGSGNTVTVGIGDDVINAGDGGAVVHAVAGNDTITAAGAGNLLDGGAGLSFLNADGSANNVFMLAAAGTPSADCFTSLAYATMPARNARDAPGTETIASAIAPPVTDSATASVWPRRTSSPMLAPPIVVASSPK